MDVKLYSFQGLYNFIFFTIFAPGIPCFCLNLFLCDTLCCYYGKPVSIFVITFLLHHFSVVIVVPFWSDIVPIYSFWVSGSSIAHFCWSSSSSIYDKEVIFHLTTLPNLRTSVAISYVVSGFTLLFVLIRSLFMFHKFFPFFLFYHFQFFVRPLIFLHYTINLFFIGSLLFPCRSLAYDRIFQCPDINLVFFNKLFIELVNLINFHSTQL